VKACYRYRTSTLVGAWRQSPEKALDDAVAAGQATRTGTDPVQWQVGGTVQESICNLEDAPCGGIYPPPD